MFDQNFQDVSSYVKSNQPLVLSAIFKYTLSKAKVTVSTSEKSANLVCLKNMQIKCVKCAKRHIKSR